MAFAARVGLLFALALFTLGANRSESDVVRLLEQMRGAAGPVWQTHLVSVSRLTLGGQQNVVSSDSEGLRITVRHCTGEVCSGTYFDGIHLYSLNLNDTALAPSLEPEPFLRSLRLIASLFFRPVSWRGAGVSAAPEARSLKARPFVRSSSATLTPCRSGSTSTRRTG